MICDGLISGHLGLDLLRPFVDPADEVLGFTEPNLPEEVRDPARADAGLAIDDDFVGRAELIHSGRNLATGIKTALSRRAISHSIGSRTSRRTTAFPPSIFC